MASDPQPDTVQGARAPRKNPTGARRRRRTEPSRYVQVLMPESLIQDLDVEYSALPDEIRPPNRSAAIVMCVRYFVLKMRERGSQEPEG